MAFHSCILCGWKNEKLHLFKFPKKDEKRLVWLQNSSLPETTVTKNAYLCIHHFVNSNFTKPANDPQVKRLRLKSDAVPSIFDCRDKNEETLECANEDVQSRKVTHSCILCGLIQNTAEKISFMRFPKDEAQRKEWRDHFQIDPSTNLDNVRICSRHFSIDENPSTHRRKKIKFAETNVDYGAMRKHIRVGNLDPPSNEGECNAEDPPSNANTSGEIENLLVETIEQPSSINMLSSTFGPGNNTN